MLEPTATDSEASRRRRVLAIASCLAAIACFSCIPVFLRHLRHYLDAWTVNAVRYGTAALFWLPTVVLLGRRFRSRGGAETPLPRRSVWLAAIVPSAVNLLGQVGWALCPYYVNATTIGFVIRTSFLFTAVLGLLFIPSERGLARRPLFGIGLAATIAGVLLMYVQKLTGARPTTGAEAVGLVIILATALFWAAYAVSVRRCLGGYPLRLAFGVVSLYTTAGLLVLMLLLGSYHELGRLAAREWALLVGSGLIGIAFGHVLYHRGIHGVGPIVASGIMMLGPFLTYALAAVVLGEAMTLLQFGGGLAVVAGGLALIKAQAQAEATALPLRP